MADSTHDTDSGQKPTTVTKVEEWEDPDENDGEWPYPTTYVKYLVTGELADRSRARLGAADDAAVYLTESVESGGYSEWTQENYYAFTVEADGHVAEFTPPGYWADDNVLVELLRWLDGTS